MATTAEAAPIPTTTANVIDEKTGATATEAIPASSSASTNNSTPAPTKTAPTDPTPAPVPSAAAARVDTTAAITEAPPSGPRKTPFPTPISSFKPTPTKPLTADQETKYETVLATVKSWSQIPTTSSKKPETSPLTPTEKLWLTRECLLRYLRATKWNTIEANKRLLATLVWRREYGVEGFTAEYISEENATGKQVLAGFDYDGRPCLYLLPSRQNTKLSDRQVHHLVYMLERTIDLQPAGQETLSLLIDYSQTSNGQGPPLSQSKAVLSILQNHYPERLGRALIMNVPWFIQAFYKLISPFIDPVTKSKMKFNEPLKNHVPAEQLLKSHGGDAEFEYDHNVFWPALNGLAEQRRRSYRKWWEVRGGLIGDSEWHLKGGETEGQGHTEVPKEACEKKG